MMTLEQVLKYVNYICVKENAGSTLQPQQFNTILNASNTNMFNRKVIEAQLYGIKSNKPFSEAIQSVVALREFHVKENITFTAGVFDITTLTNSYAYWSTMTSLYNGSQKQIELLTDIDLIKRRTNMLSKGLYDYPAATIFGNSIKVYPSDITTAEFYFLKNPVTPVFDYWIDTQAIIHYMAPNETHVLESTQEGSAGQVAPTEVTSLTVELEWNSLWHIEFCNEVLQKVGVNLKDEQIKQYVREVEGLQK